MAPTGTGAARSPRADAADDVARAFERVRESRQHPLAVEYLYHLEPTWDHAESFLHRLWGQARAGEYRKTEWAAFQSLLSRLRYEPTASERSADAIAGHLLRREPEGVFRWLANWLQGKR